MSNKKRDSETVSPWRTIEVRQWCVATLLKNWERGKSVTMAQLTQTAKELEDYIIRGRTNDRPNEVSVSAGESDATKPIAPEGYSYVGKLPGGCVSPGDPFSSGAPETRRGTFDPDEPIDY